MTNIFPRPRALPLLLLLALGPTWGAAGSPADPGRDPLPRPRPAALHPLPTLEEALGVRPGEKVLGHEEVLRYARLLAAASPRVELEIHGASVEGRELFQLVITDPARHGKGSSDLPEPVVVWLAGAVHGDEHSSTEALLLAAWHLAADATPEGEERLAGAVVVIDPLQNPDGRERFRRHLSTARFGAPQPEPEAWEHRQDWPGGRGNHFFFDLNRDWFLLTQPESRARAAAFRRRAPHVFVDLHEMSGESSYFFAPPAEPIHSLVPGTVRAWWGRFGAAVSAALDQRGVPFFRRERFDIFYPGYGDSWPTFSGAVGMTYEQASVRGWLWRRPDGRVVPAAEAIGNHLTAVLATVATAARHREDLLAQAGPAARGVGGRAGAWTFFVPPGPAPARVRRLAERLAAQGIAVQWLQEPLHLREAGGYRGEAPGPVDLAAGSLVVRTDAGAGRLAVALLAPDEPLPEAFVAAERERLAAGLPGTVYDVTAWSLPLVHDLPAVWTRRPVQAATSATPPALPPPPAAAARAAYLLPPQGLAWSHAVGALLDQGVKVRVAERSLTREGRELPAGTAVIPVAGNVADLHQRLRRAAARAGATWLAADSSASEAGVDLGSDAVVPLAGRRIAVVLGDPVAPTSFGALADLLVNGSERPFVALPVDRLAAADLSRFGVLVLPDGDTKRYLQAVGVSARQALDRFVAAGGLLVAIKGAAAFCAHPDVGLARTRAERATGAAGEGGEKRPDEKPPPESAPWPERVFWSVPGAILRVELRTVDRLAGGQLPAVPVPVHGDLKLVAEESDKVQVVGRYAEGERLHLAGLVWPEAAARLAGSAWLVREQRGRGTLLLFAGEPAFRGAWDGLRTLLMQALMVEGRQP